MSPKIKFYLKIFLFSSTIMGIVMTLANLIFGVDVVFLQILMVAILVGIFQTWIFVKMQKDGLRKQGVTYLTAETLNLHQSKTITTEVSKEQILDEIRKRLSSRKINFEEIDNTIQWVSISTDLSGGEKVTVEFASTPEGSTEVKISSKPKSSVIIMDSGKNFKNVRGIEKMILGLRPINVAKTIPPN